MNPDHLPAATVFQTIGHQSASRNVAQANALLSSHPIDPDIGEKVEALPFDLAPFGLVHVAATPFYPDPSA